ncbi:MAG TPA: hypothetical protein VHD35_07990 [Chitinophagaceae bacterium]|nr:hypothetical protein [Chitinophagaceae bacterium]
MGADYIAGTHLQGKLLGTILDLVMLHPTRYRKTINEVIGLIKEKFRVKEFESKEIDLVVSDI